MALEHHLYILISQYLKEHPTTDETPLRLPIPGMPEPKLPIPPSPVPRGWKLNNILPLHSAAMSGGGVSENAFKDMMAEQLGLIDGTAAASGDDKKKKDKKKKGK